MKDTIELLGLGKCKYAIMVRVEGELILCPGRYDTRESAQRAQASIMAGFDLVHLPEIVVIGEK